MNFCTLHTSIHTRRVRHNSTNGLWFLKMISKWKEKLVNLSSFHHVPFTCNKYSQHNRIHIVFINLTRVETLTFEWNRKQNKTKWHIYQKSNPTWLFDVSNLVFLFFFFFYFTAEFCVPVHLIYLSLFHNYKIKRKKNHQNVPWWLEWPSNLITYTTMY